ncbi:glycosyltransferase [Marivita sp. GX14005]|uniref:glycosyltransferase n=1 Tax=Marivita sp. GX14005 TaxID=2942276 RepID=UPI0020186AE4|nr:glycosyltransferase [Marivita sp. GX14005]MCL3883969.1 glycosyltransferase [Marivita sp. GX14005]
MSASPSDLPHVTILMGTRNGAAHLRAQLASLAAQDHRNWSLWIGDDGSTDATRAVIRDFAAHQPNPVLLWPGPQRGLSANYLSLLCHPDLPPGPVAFADQDDLWLPGHLRRGLNALAQEPPPAAGQVYGAHRLVWPEGRAPQPMTRRTGAPIGFRNALVECMLVGSGLMLDGRAAALARRAGLVDVPFWDWWLYLLFTGAGARILRDARPGLLYRAHGGNQLGPRHGPRAALRRIAGLLDGTYRQWTETNLAALEPHMALLTPEAQEILRAALSLAPRPRLRRLSAHRHWPRDRVALWLGA